MSEVGTWTVRRLLEWTGSFFDRKKVEPARLSAELLLSHVLNLPRIKLYVEYDRVVAEPHLGAFRELVQRAAAEEPIAYLTGRAHFFNLEFDVTRDVLVPRPDTETLVENVLQLIRNQPGLEQPRVLDLCTGSGCIAAAIAHHRKSAIVVATDISAPAAEVARRNIDRLGLKERVTVAVGDLFEPLAGLPDARPFDLIVSNPPYIRHSDIQTLDRSVREYEPITALDGGEDGLQFHRRILEGATDRLTAGGHVFIEIAFDQGPAAMELAATYGNSFEPARLLKDLGGRDRVLTARKRAVSLWCLGERHDQSGDDRSGKRRLLQEPDRGHSRLPGISERDDHLHGHRSRSARGRREPLPEGGAALGAEPTIEATTDRLEALRGADFVINMVQIGGFDSTLVDFEISRKYGLNFTIADTTGPGGLFRALRTYPMLTALCREMQEVCPHALLLNYSNPMSMNMQTISRTSEIRAVGLCHSVQGTLDQLMGYIGEDARQVAFTCAGINHMAFYLKLEKDGRDLYPRLFEAMRRPEVYDSNRVRFELMKRLGYFVTESSEHNAEYSPWFIPHGRGINRAACGADRRIPAAMRQDRWRV